MYSFVNLGEKGRLGNQMFQYATLLSLVRQHKSIGVIPDAEIEIYKAFPNLSLKKMLRNDIINQCKWIYSEHVDKDFCYNSNVFTVRDDTIIDGFFQSPLYFEMIKEEVFEEFTFSNEVTSKCSSEYKDIKVSYPDSNICAVHIRRTDYLTKPDFHLNLSLEDYYYPTMNFMSTKYPKTTFLVFSDDYEWCKSNLPPEMIYPASSDQYHDMCLMSMCDSHIIANSSFSWWGAYLSKKNNDSLGGEVIAPGQWFGKDGPFCATIWDPSWTTVGINNPMSIINNLSENQKELLCNRHILSSYNQG
jgi:hypothetical protein